MSVLQSLVYISIINENGKYSLKDYGQLFNIAIVAMLAVNTAERTSCCFLLDPLIAKLINKPFQL